ncbi:helix-turn-helix transcriptional regulator [Methylobacterium sp. SI9]|uniref:helix-turn-helix domain-containing protein n=1 Tax=Methylobacterium guangdongense TaxID=3138811 RepID=UPI00313EBC33
MTIVRTRTPSGEAIVILPEAEFERLRDLAEDTLDARLVEDSLARLASGEEEILSEADLDALRAASSPLAFWRSRRGVTASALGKACGLAEADIIALEAGTRIVDMAVYRRVARALGIDAEDLVPDAC